MIRCEARWARVARQLHDTSLAFLINTGDGKPRILQDSVVREGPSAAGARSFRYAG
jgi:hypothetical protein